MRQSINSRAGTAAGVKADAALRVQDLWFGYGRWPVLQGVTFEVGRGRLAGLVGPNGSGKSTLMRAVLGLVKPWRGRVEVLGTDVDAARPRVSYTPQAEMVDWSFPVTVLDVVTMGRYRRPVPFRRPGRADREQAMEALRRVGMDGLARRQIGELSGGQQRRVLIARSLAREPALLLLDEPMAGLDAVAQHELLTLFEALRAEGCTLLVATHDLSCVSSRFDEALFLNRRIIAHGPPADVFTAENLNATFQHHLLLLDVEGRVYHAGHR
ncbi:MAG TPA: metal ABC transporter ATP-binding protein [Dehalococcoidia bacterium]